MFAGPSSDSHLESGFGVQNSDDAPCNVDSTRGHIWQPPSHTVGKVGAEIPLRITIYRGYRPIRGCFGAMDGPGSCSEFVPSTIGMSFAPIRISPHMNRDNLRWYSGAERRTSKAAGRSASRLSGRADQVILVRLTRKYADMIDGVNLDNAAVGDRLELPRHDADLLLAEGWAELVAERRVRLLPRRSQAADSSRPPKKKH